MILTPPPPLASLPSRKRTPPISLFPHATGRCGKKIRGKAHYFLPGMTPKALAKYLEQKDALHAGRKPREASGGVTITSGFRCGFDGCLDRGTVESGQLLDRGKFTLYAVRCSSRTFGRYPAESHGSAHSQPKLRFSKRPFGPIQSSFTSRWDSVPASAGKHCGGPCRPRCPGSSGPGHAGRVSPGQPGRTPAPRLREESPPRVAPRQPPASARTAIAPASAGPRDPGMPGPQVRRLLRSVEVGQASGTGNSERLQGRDWQQSA